METTDVKITFPNKNNDKDKFLFRLYDFLQEGTQTELVDWSSEGDSIYIKNQKEFSEQVLPMLFNHHNFNSFVRQLNMYNFRKIKNSEFGCFYANPNFRRDSRSLLQNVERRKPYKKAEKIQEPETYDAKTRKPDELENENSQLRSQVKRLQIQMDHAHRVIDQLQMQNRLLDERYNLEKKAILMGTCFCGSAPQMPNRFHTNKDELGYKSWIKELRAQDSHSNSKLLRTELARNDPQDNQDRRYLLRENTQLFNLAFLNDDGKNFNSEVAAIMNKPAVFDREILLTNEHTPKNNSPDDILEQSLMASINLSRNSKISKKQIEPENSFNMEINSDMQLPIPKKWSGIPF